MAIKRSALILSKDGNHLETITADLIAAGWRCEVITTKLSSLSKVKGLSFCKFFEVKSYEEELLAYLNSSNEEHDLTLYGDDGLLHFLAQSTLSAERKLRYLPVKKVEGIPLLGSKIGFVEIAERIGISIPQTFIVQSTNEVHDLSSKLSYPQLLKSDEGAGGERVARIANSDTDLTPLEELLPGVLQREVPGKTVSVEAIFNNGTLVAWVYSEELQTVAEFGASSWRRYSTPPTTEFFDDLVAMGEYVAAHGFANCTFKFDGEKYLLFEMDLRANHWCNLFTHFGINPATVLAPDYSGAVASPVFTEPIVIINYLRALFSAAQHHRTRDYFRTVMAYRRSTSALTGSGGFFRITLMGKGIFILALMPKRLAEKVRGVRKSGKRLFRR